MSKPTVFISYSHKDEVWKDRLIPHLMMLEHQDRLAVWDDRQIDAGEFWYPEILEAIERAAVSVCLISANFLGSDFCAKEEIPFLLNRRDREGMVLIPVLIDACAFELVDWLKPLQMLPRDGKSVSIDYKATHSVVFTQVARRVSKALQDPDYRTEKAEPRWTSISERCIDIDRLPQTGFELFGRQKELELLDKAWGSAKPNIISLVAYGGVGKSTLVNKWLERLAADNYRGAERVYGWSFYSQGTDERVTSADYFFNEALQWFGFSDPTSLGDWEKGEKLAELVRRHKTLLILDGLEPLQSPYEFERGKVKDPALEMLITRLARENPGLCIITTRERLGGLGAWGEAVVQEDLEQISAEAARSLLRVGGVRGTDSELEEVSRQFGPQALAIQLLAVYLRDFLGHPLPAAAQIPDLDLPVERGKHPRRVIVALERRLPDQAARDLLHVLGLFDRPASNLELKALRGAPAIAGLTEHLCEQTESEWQATISTMRSYRLLAPRNLHRPDALDAHPLLREHFAENLQRYQQDAWREGHRRLYQCLKNSVKELPDTLQEMMPLYQSVAHGCRAGLQREAFKEVYWPRIRRRKKAFSWKVLGEFGADLAAISVFFERAWDRPSRNLDLTDQAFVLNAAGFHLRALGRLSEAETPLRAALKAAVSMEDFKGAAQVAFNLSELHLTLGNLEKALKNAEYSVELAKRSRDTFWVMANQTALADVLHQSGEFAQAHSLFQEAEQQRVRYPLLYSLRGYRYCDLLLGECELLAWWPVDLHAEAIRPHPQAIVCCRKTRERAAETLQWAEKENLSLLTLALDNLTLGRTFLLEAALEIPSPEVLSMAQHHLDLAITGLRRAGDVAFVARGLIARSQLHRFQGRFTRACEDLAESSYIASRGPMLLHLADIHLERCRLNHAQENLDQARESLHKARAVIQEHAYHRRDLELKALEKELGEAT